MRPIDADAIPYTMLYKENWLKGTGREEQGVWKSDIDKMPTIEPKTGRWIDRNEGNGVHFKFRFRCSACSSAEAYESNYCPNCGARMEDGNE